MIPLSLAELGTADGKFASSHPDFLYAPAPSQEASIRDLEMASLDIGVIAQRKGDVPRALLWAAKAHVALYQAYRPCYRGRVSAGLDSAGYPVAWRHRVASPVGDTQDETHAFREGVDAVEGAVAIPYAIANILVDYVREEPHGANPDSWRGARLANNVFAVESFLDELAALGNVSPADYRRTLLAESPRALHVLELAISRSNWNSPLKSGSGRGIAVLASSGSFLALVAEVEAAGREVRVLRVTCALDCGLVLDPDAAVEETKRGILFGLGAALHTGAAPSIETHLVKSSAAPGGIGECGAAAIAPAVANAIFNASGKRIRKLPIVASTKEIS